MTETIWNGFKRIDFTFEGMDAIVVFPEKANDERNWLLKTEYFEAFPTLEIEMLKKGWHVLYVGNITRWCKAEDIDRKARFSKAMIKEYNLSPKCVPVGMSCGGMIGTLFAAKYPELISSLYLDAPVIDVYGSLMLPKNADMLVEFIDAMGMTEKELSTYKEQPKYKLEILIKNNIPVIMVYGDSDEIVPYEINGLLLEKYYRENGGIIETYGKAGCGHHPHGLDDSTCLIEFIERY